MNENIQKPEVKSDVQIPTWYEDTGNKLEIRIKSFQKYHKNCIAFLLEKYTQSIKKKSGRENTILTSGSIDAIQSSDINPNSYSEEKLGNLINFHKKLVASLME